MSYSFCYFRSHAALLPDPSKEKEDGAGRGGQGGGAGGVGSHSDGPF